ncbi:hypothetical protein CHH28_09120 [Bacterioplanes sanyensis]|uniref:Uncharacterized protein n=1 Tax=Bacterioplanes sanyensis TaxID=1249553 RepID=A0A222FJ79_9GAMM|nr:hypothetical protein CHH28_09120 [Bacterioplanes sanyensis]
MLALGHHLMQLGADVKTLLQHHLIDQRRDHAVWVLLWPLAECLVDAGLYLLADLLGPGLVQSISKRHLWKNTFQIARRLHSPHVGRGITGAAQRWIKQQLIVKQGGHGSDHLGAIWGAHKAFIVAAAANVRPALRAI